MIFLFFLPLILLVCFSGIAFFVNAAMFKPYKKIKPPADGRKVTFKSGRNCLVGYLWNESGTRGLVVFAHGMGTGSNTIFPRFIIKESNGHMTVVRKKGSQTVNEDTICHVDTFLDKILRI